MTAHGEINWPPMGRFSCPLSQQDQQWRAQLGHGVPPSAIPNGSSPAEALFAAELDSQVYLPRRASVAEDLLSNGGLTFHPLSPTEE